MYDDPILLRYNNLSLKGACHREAPSIFLIKRLFLIAQPVKCETSTKYDGLVYRLLQYSACIYQDYN